MYILPPPRQLQAQLRESGDDVLLRRFDVEAWGEGWFRSPLPELGRKSPIEVLRHASGWVSVERVLESMRRGVRA